MVQRTGYPSDLPGARPHRAPGWERQGKFLKTSEDKHFEIDTDTVKSEAVYDGKWVLRADLGASAKEVALHYKYLWMVETFFRGLKSIMENRPIYYKCDETIRGHVFCGFLALVLFQELQLSLVERRSDRLETGPTPDRSYTRR